MDKLQDNLEGLTKKKSWITEDQKIEVWEKLNDTREWITYVTGK